MAGVVFQIPDDKVFGFLHRKAGNALQFAPVLFLLRLDNALALFQGGKFFDKFLVLLVVLGGALVKQLLFVAYARLIALHFRAALAVFPLLLVSFPNEFIFCVEQNFFFLSFSFSNCILS